MIPQKQNKKEFSELIQKNQAIIHKITRVYENGWANREDLFQEICLQLWKSYSNFREEAQFSTWMYRVALNTAISNVRKKKNGFSFELLRATDRISEESSDEKDRVNLLYRAISRLNRIDKAIILLWLEEKNYEEIAAIMGTSKTNVSVKLVRIKRKLEELVSETVKQES
ncbi:MAG: sigma-70 family RNA polymerase sigma factor [Prolixibacteraceae bacterium]|jgi:RNA polymerase sigma-70 factor, ECF subfamily|nr:sigma-70 family RNA polymerase sigma factor [Prolixibacteraceae bacterium]MBT6006585.1 sigma-70 family RNA polymerase sigma factor [Prolixibacteraceae bacterium]MBT6763608.1 sigma-70 family RNA polymerase sigma factor [Prolixibacteraceae bacterium]MBT7000355.1 sigma-70 family RNA polymerase sigma factor [Prolixibacteraceae bacterium]MBT7395399.1 sigma-70 family RNA polymerase sigma factor [Prolixibacteraceae bacterium]